MTDSDQPGRRWFLRMQSVYVLPLARGICLLIALACLIAVIGGISYVVFLQASIVGQPTPIPVPPPYQDSEPAEAVSDRAIDLAVVQSRLEPPTNIRFVTTIGAITEPPRAGQVLGRFVADTRNGLAPFPDGISLLGGPDAELFERVREGSKQGIGLAAKTALVAELTETLRDIQATTSRTFTIRVVARDPYGVVSAPTDLSFTLTLGPKSAASAEPPPALPSVPTELQSIAREIARIVEPEVNPAHFAAYRTALKVPARCGTKDNDWTFLANYRQAIEAVRPRLTAANVEAVYLGLCEAWKGVLQREAAEREQVEQRRRAARRAADEARSRALAHNNERLRQHENRVSRAKLQTAVTLSAVGGALTLFLSVALILAFLAIEGHSRAIRTAMEAMVRATDSRQSQESTPNNP
jgi:hypothetical protein